MSNYVFEKMRQPHSTDFGWGSVPHRLSTTLSYSLFAVVALGKARVPLVLREALIEVA